MLFNLSDQMEIGVFSCGHSIEYKYLNYLIKIYSNLIFKPSSEIEIYITKS